MKHILFSQLKFSLFLVFMVSTVGCSHYPARANDTMPTPQANPPHTALINESRAEADLLRSELAAIKIAAAKQHAELRSALNRVESLQTREEDMSSKIQQIKNTLLIAEGERDQLRRENVALQAQSASLPDLQQLMSEVHSIQASVHQMVANMKTLMTEVIHIKQDMRLNRSKAQREAPSLTAFSMTTSSPSAPGNGIWTVSAGDTLWSISQNHAMSVKALMDMNELDSDIIVKGQVLKVPVLASHETGQEH